MPRTSAWASSLIGFILDGARPGDLLPWGARLVTVTADDDTVHLATSRDGASVVAWLRPRTAGGGAYRTTLHFLVGHEGTSLDAAGLRLLDELCAAIVRREPALPARLLAAMHEHARTPGSDVPIEWLAVRAGVKPAARQVPRGAVIAELVASTARQGLHAISLDARDYLADFASGLAAGCETILYVGATPEAARAALDAERGMIAAVARSERVSPTLNAALGRALGYPECCIAFFIPRSDLSPAVLRFEALRATGGPAFALLNDLDPARSLVSHFVCRYDCTASLRYARDVLDAVRDADAGRAEELSASLEGVVVLFGNGGALQLAGARAAGDDRYVYRSMTVHGVPAAHQGWVDVLQDADEVRIDRGQLAPFRNGEALATIPFDTEDVQIRPFVRAP